MYNTLIHPNRDIPPTASAGHHITLKHVADKPLFEEVGPTVMGYLEGAVIVAHNTQFDRSMIPETGSTVDLLYRLGRHLWPDDAPAFGNQVLNTG
ncbi:3'-5' exonuclease [Alicyclobacillus dauci]|uniref:3'-5' exonuclease n=1 Tax=Alicyclobacillus dauci TaxID=1475485 RepID=A0ABY6Z2Z1_9BACL|nr:3'-5' exonuclease [Alicyclobacillus dauci]WAH37257.1 3'-5' exonuclease [Alicyclobacillus dauci]